MPKDNYPNNDEDTLYINTACCAISITDLLEVAQAHFGEDITVDELSIEADYIHTRCITYDRYDSSDYDNYIIIRKEQTC